MLTKRLEILFEQKEFEVIKKKAKMEGKSVATLVRDALKDKVLDSSLSQKQQALKRLFSHTTETRFSEWKKEKKAMIKARVKDIETH
jgi:hypothetical protein